MKNLFTVNMNKDFSYRDANIGDICQYFLFLKLFLGKTNVMCPFNFLLFSPYQIFFAKTCCGPFLPSTILQPMKPDFR